MFLSVRRATHGIIPPTIFSKNFPTAVPPYFCTTHGKVGLLIFGDPGREDERLLAGPLSTTESPFGEPLPSVVASANGAVLPDG